MTFVKICGLTRAEDAGAAIAEGADAVGFIFWPKSPRFITAERARDIVKDLDARAIPIGVFVNQTCDDINRIADIVGLGAVQLHGDETPACAAGVERPVIKAVSACTGEDDEAEQWPREVTLLVDAHDDERRGGTGRLADWERASALSRRRRVVLAGGLTPENVAEAVAAVRPYGIDVSSGVEARPGIKDPKKLAALFRALEAMNR